MKYRKLIRFENISMNHDFQLKFHPLLLQRQRKRKWDEDPGPSSSHHSKHSRNEYHDCVDPRSFLQLSDRLFSFNGMQSRQGDRYEMLSDFIWHFFNTHSQNSSLYEAKIEIWSQLQRVLSRRFGCATHVFGSTLNGFGK